MAMKSRPLIEIRAKKAMMMPFSRTRVLGMPTTHQVSPQLLQEITVRAGGVEGARMNRLVPLEPGLGVRLHGAGALGPREQQGLSRWRHQSAGYVVGRCHAHDAQEMPILRHCVVGRVTGEDLATEGRVGGVAVGGHRVGATGWLSLAR